MTSKHTKQSIYKEIQERGPSGMAFRKKEKKSFAEELVREGKVKKIGEKYYSSDIDLSSIASRRTKQSVCTKQSVYEEIQEKGLDGKTFRSEEKKSFAEELVREGKVKKIGGKYYSGDIDLDFMPLKQERVIQRLLELETLKKSGKRYIFTEKIRLLREPSVQPEFSFSEFLETVQDLYLREAGHYRESVRLTPLINNLTSKLGIPRDLAEKWILELPKIFIGIVDLRPFTGEHGIMLKNGTEVTRIYLSRELVGL
ncbi:MAG: hypothetical protein WBA22_14140 [Candidatus Methanofastidiosia archaeon]